MMVRINLADRTAGCGRNGIPRSVVSVMMGGGMPINWHALLNMGGVVIYSAMLLVVIVL